MTEKKENNVEIQDLEEVISEKYLAYALSTIMSRSLPDVRDGLKPVHRRLLYAMMQLKLDPSENFKKCARVVGDVTGKFHPHGEVAVYDTLVRLAQSFSLRYPLIDGQGNFGSIDGDNPAAMRYTESRLTQIATYLIKDIEKDTVNFRPTYDNNDEEPTLLPAAFPNILANGSEGIAVGMATSIPPHNLDELIQASIYLIDNPDSTIENLMNFVEGPDFPTGGIIIEDRENIINIYSSGRGSIKIRSKYEVENLSHGMYQVIISEIPYMVQKSKLIEQIANLLRDKKIPLIGNIRDESTEDVRIVIEPKNRGCDPEILMESLFKQSMLESRFNFNMNVLGKNGLPEVMNLKQILLSFIEHRFEIVTRRTKFDLDKTDKKIEILEGFLICYLNIDEVIRIIREEDDAKSELISKFNISDTQAESILNMKLRSLRKLEEIEIKKELDSLSKLKSNLESILNSKTKCWSVIKSELIEINKLFGKNTQIGKRKTIFQIPSNTPVNFTSEAMIEKEAITVILSKLGWIKSIKGNLEDISSLKFKDGDEFLLSHHCFTTDYLIFVTKEGKFFTILADNIQKGKGHGEPIKLLVDISPTDEVISTFTYNKDGKILLASSLGKGFIINQSDVFAQTKLGKQIMNLPDNSKVIKACFIEEKHNMVGCVGSHRKLLVFALEEIPTLKKGQGVTLMKLKDAKLNDIQLFASSEGFSWQKLNNTKQQNNLENWHGKRGGSGRIPPLGFPKNNCFFNN